MPRIALADGVSLHCAQDDYLWPWNSPEPVLMLHGFSRNARFWNRWVPPIAETHRIYRPDLLGCGESLWEGLEGLEERFAVESASSPSGVTHITFTRR